MDTQKFIERSRKVHGTRYDYSQVEYKNARTKVKIGCSSHGFFNQVAESHYRGMGCHKCGVELRSQRGTKTTAEFIADAFAVHGPKYDYSETEYVGAKNPVNVRCYAHGVFTQEASSHLSGHGCPRCKGMAMSEDRLKTTEDFIAEALAVHGDRYDYEVTEYKGARALVTIGCRLHGNFRQRAGNHLRGFNCPSCGMESRLTNLPKGTSAAELDLFREVQALFPAAVNGFYLGGSQFDIQAGTTLIEYHGLYWHSSGAPGLKNPVRDARGKHIKKRNLAEKHGYRYVAIYEDEWRDRRGVLIDYLKSLLGAATIAGARKFNVQEIDGPTARDFYEAHHLLGAGSPTGRHMALVDDQGATVACMSIGKSKERRGAHDSWSLSRFATDGRNIAGAASRLLAAFGPLPELVSYVDLDKYTGGVYGKLGFEPAGEIPPDYWTIWPSRTGPIRRHKSATRRDALARMPGFNPNESEAKNTHRMGLFQIYHSGRLRVVRPADPGYTRK